MFSRKKEIERLQAENRRLRAAIENKPALPAPARSAEYWYTPTGYSWTLCDDILSGIHWLIAGTTGCGKSTLINSILFSALMKSPEEVRFILCDPKRVELSRYKFLPHTLTYANDVESIIAALQKAIAIMEKRYAIMESAGVQRYSGGPEIYIVIDEIADLMLSASAKRFTRLLQRLLQLSRAAGIHVILATQSPARAVIPAVIQLNCGKVGLRCASAIESRQAIGFPGCENLPEHGVGYFVAGMKTEKREIPLTPPEEIAERIAFWEAQV